MELENKTSVKPSNNGIGENIKNNPNLWDNIGVYPTPSALTKSFVDFILNEITIKNNTSKQILDLFAGDGRLGLLFSSKLKKIECEHNLHFIEIRPNTISKEELNEYIEVINSNAFSVNKNGFYDIVISNPPYLILNASLTEQLGFTWNEVKCFSRNLYGLGIKKGLEMCKSGGYLAVIAPFGYVRGEQSSEFRNYIYNQCSKVWIRANSERNAFSGVSQDIAFQIFRKRGLHETQKCNWKFAYNGEKYKSFKILLPLTSRNAVKYVRVGTIVWNREKEFLCDKRDGNICLIYGGNISHQGELVFNLRRYKHKQYIKPKGTNPLDIITPPFIVIRRTIRGKPGSWEIDIALVLDKSVNYAGENHIISVELPELPKDQLLYIHQILEKKILDYYFHSGSPNISTKVVGKLFSELILKYL